MFESMVCLYMICTRYAALYVLHIMHACMHCTLLSTALPCVPDSVVCDVERAIYSASYVSSWFPDFEQFLAYRSEEKL